MVQDQRIHIFLFALQILLTNTQDNADICKNIITPVNGHMIKITSLSTLYRYNCNPGYVLTGSPLIRNCLHSGSWTSQEEPTCEDIDECVKSSSKDYPCDEFADCFNTEGSYRCVCRTGYVGDGHSCSPDGLELKDLMNSGTCGKVTKKSNHTRKRVRRIISGRYSEHGEWPWVALITANEGIVPHFSGVLIQPGWVLTIASLLVSKDGKDIDPSDVHISLGKKDRNKPEDEEQPFNVKKIHKHPKFHRIHNLNNDIALLQLDKNAEMTDYVNTICMVHLRKARKFEKPRHLATIAGWGLTIPIPVIVGKDHNINNALFSGALQDITIPLVGPHKCKKATAYFFHKKTMLCAGQLDSQAAPCMGDGGSPLMLQDPDTKRWVLLGLFSWSEGCGQPSKYSYYTRVNRYRRWILDVTHVKKS